MYLSLEAQKVVHGMHTELARIRLSLKLKNMVVYEKLRSRGIFLGLRFFQDRYYNATTTNCAVSFPGFVIRRRNRKLRNTASKWKDNDS